MKKLWIEKCILVLIIAVSLVTMIVYGDQKEGYHLDEIYSYGLANSEYLPFMHFGESGYGVKDWMLEYGAGESFGDIVRNLIKDFQILKECGFDIYSSEIYQDYLIAQANSADTFTTTWVSGQDYVDYLAVSESNTFNYASVYYNQRGDVHPPLYYILLHTVCSVFQGTFSKWFGLGINFALLTATLLLLYHMVKKYFGGAVVALSVTAAYGLSNGFMTSAMYLRMYALLTLMTVLYFYVHLRIAEGDFVIMGRKRLLLILTTLGGFLTHYYFVLYAIGIAVVFVVWMGVRKRWKPLLQYLLTLSFTAVGGLCIWPFALKHVFQGYRGQASLSTILSGEFYLSKTRLLLGHITWQMMGGQWWLLLLGFVLLAIIFIRSRGKNMPVAKGLLLVLPVAWYILLVSQIVPYLVERYVMCTFPFWCLATVAGVSYSVDKLVKKPWKQWVAVLAGGLLIVFGNCYSNPPDYLYPGGQEVVVVPDHTDCVYVLPGDSWNESAGDSSILAQCDHVAVVYQDNLDCLKGTYDYQAGRVLMVSVQKELDMEAVLADVKKALGVEELQESARLYGGNAVSILLTK